MWYQGKFVQKKEYNFWVLLTRQFSKLYDKLLKFLGILEFSREVETKKPLLNRCKSTIS